MTTDEYNELLDLLVSINAKLDALALIEDMDEGPADAIEETHRRAVERIKG